MTVEEIKLRRIKNHYLIDKEKKQTVVKNLCGIQAQFMVNAIHSLKIRCVDFDEETVSDGLVKNWTIRGTVHVFSEDDLPLFINCNDGKTYRSNEWKGYSFWNQRDKWALSPERQKYFSDIILSSLSDSSKSREYLKEICRNHGMIQSEEDSMFDPWGGGIRELCERGFINYTVKEKKEYCISPDFSPMKKSDAEIELARRYFTNFGPATIHDAQYFFKTTAAKIKQWIEVLPVESFDCENKTYYFINNGKTYNDDIPECIFLAGFDQLMLGYEKKESLFLKPENLRGIFNLAGIVMPSILFNGNVVGKWKKKNGTFTAELFGNVSEKDIKKIKESAAGLWNDITKTTITTK